MGGFYAGYLGAHNNQPPKDEVEFRAYLATQQEALDKAGLSIDEMFLSPRGGPLAWVYGARPPVGPMGMTYVAYETTPVDGKRLVIAGGGMTKEMDDAEFRQVFPNVP
jgi:hypothetical protein